MQKNVGRTDRNVRYVIGGLLVIAAVAGFAGVLPGLAGMTALYGSILALVVGAVLLITAYTQTCLLYGLFGVSTRSEAGEPAAESMPSGDEEGTEEADFGSEPKAH